MEVVTSIHNERVKQARALQNRRERKERGLLLIEGPRFIQEAVSAGAHVQSCFFVDNSLTNAATQLATQLAQAGTELVPVSPQVMASIADTDTPQGMVAVAVAPPQAGPEVLVRDRVVLVIDEVRDPGNIGTMLRTAAAVNAAVILLSGCADFTSPKVIRGSAGACYAVPIWSSPQLGEVHASLVGSAYQTVVLDMHGPKSYYQANLTGRVAIVVGNEGHGPNPAWSDLGTNLVHIPMPGRAESLNAGVAAAVVLYEALRQRTC